MVRSVPLVAERAARTDLAEHFSAGLSQGYAWSELEALCELTEDQLLALHGFGPSCSGNHAGGPD